MRAISLILLLFLGGVVHLRAERGTHEWVVRGPGGLYGLIQYDWVRSTTDDKVCPMSEVTWPISSTTHRVHSYTFVYFAQRHFSVPLSAPSALCITGAAFAVAMFAARRYARLRKKVT